MKKLSFILAASFAASTLLAAPAQKNQRANTNFASPNQRLEARIAELEERLDEVEFQSGLDKIKFGLDFSLGVSEGKYKLGTGTSLAPHQKFNAHSKWATEINLNMNADINEYTKFYGRLSMAKNWGQMDANSDNIYHPLDIDTGRNLRTSGSALYISRAYVDLFVSPELVFTLGRQPGTEGPGSNLRNNALRQSTYPALLFNVIGDAAVVSYKPWFLKDFDFAVRAGYGKVYQWDQEGNVKDWTSKGEVADTELYYAGVESKLPLGYGLENNLLMLSYGRLHSIAMPLNLNTTFAQLGQTMGITNNVNNIGTIDIVNLHFEAFNLWNMGLN